MTISLTAELDEFVANQVRSGRYASNSEVIRAGLRALAEQDLRAWLQEGLDDLDAGRRIEANEAFARIRATLRPTRPAKKRSRKD
jgi:antitoxin ParD1/3/4